MQPLKGTRESIGFWQRARCQRLTVVSSDSLSKTLRSAARLRDLKDPHAKVAPNGYRKTLSITLQPNHTIHTINLNSWHPLGYIPSKIVLIGASQKSFLVPMKFFHLGPHYIPKASYICWTNYEILGQKVAKRQKVRSISQLFLHCVYIPETRKTWHPPHSLGGLTLHGQSWSHG